MSRRIQIRSSKIQKQRNNKVIKKDLRQSNTQIIKETIAFKEKAEEKPEINKFKK